MIKIIRKNFCIRNQNKTKKKNVKYYANIGEFLLEKYQNLLEHGQLYITLKDI